MEYIVMYTLISCAKDFHYIFDNKEEAIGFYNHVIKNENYTQVKIKQLVDL